MQCSSEVCSLAPLVAQVRAWGNGLGGKYSVRSSEAAMGRGGARSAPFCMLMSPKKTGVRSARARTRGQNPLVLHIFLQWFESVKQQPAGEGRGLSEPGHQQAGLCSGSLQHALIRTPLEQSATPVIWDSSRAECYSCHPDSSRAECYYGHLGLL